MRGRVNTSKQHAASNPPARSPVAASPNDVAAHTPPHDHNRATDAARAVTSVDSHRTRNRIVFWSIAGIVILAAAILATSRFTKQEHLPPMPTQREDKRAEARRKRAERENDRTKKADATGKLADKVADRPLPPMPPRLTPDELVAADVNGKYELGLWTVELRVSNGKRVSVKALRNGKRAAPRLHPPTHIGVPGGETIVLECDGARLDIYIGTEKDDLIYADCAQHCMVFALGGNDMVRGTDGHDYIHTGTGRDMLQPTGGDDRHIDPGEEDWIVTEQGSMPAAEARALLAAKPKD